MESLSDSVTGVKSLIDKGTPKKKVFLGFLKKKTLENINPDTKKPADASVNIGLEDDEGQAEKFLENPQDASFDHDEDEIEEEEEKKWPCLSTSSAILGRIFMMVLILLHEFILMFCQFHALMELLTHNSVEEDEKLVLLQGIPSYLTVLWLLSYIIFYTVQSCRGQMVNNIPETIARLDWILYVQSALYFLQMTVYLVADVFCYIELVPEAKVHCNCETVAQFFEAPAMKCAAHICECYIPHAKHEVQRLFLRNLTKSSLEEAFSLNHVEADLSGQTELDLFTVLNASVHLDHHRQHNPQPHVEAVRTYNASGGRAGGAGGAIGFNLPGVPDVNIAMDILHDAPGKIFNTGFNFISASKPWTELMLIFIQFSAFISTLLAVVFSGEEILQMKGGFMAALGRAKGVFMQAFLDTMDALFMFNQIIHHPEFFKETIWLTYWMLPVVSFALFSTPFADLIYKTRRTKSRGLFSLMMSSRLIITLVTNLPFTLLRLSMIFYTLNGDESESLTGYMMIFKSLGVLGTEFARSFGACCKRKPDDGYFVVSLGPAALDDDVKKMQKKQSQNGKEKGKPSEDIALLPIGGDDMDESNATSVINHNAKSLLPDVSTGGSVLG